MIKQSLWAELIIGGSTYLLSIFFFILFCRNVKDFHFFYILKDFIPMISILIILSSYILGFLFHRLIYIFLSLMGKSETNDLEILFIRQFGNASLIESIDHQYRHIVLSRLLILGMIFLSVTSFLWFNISVYSYLKCILPPLLFLIGILSLFITLKQKKDYTQLLKSATIILNKNQLSKK